MKTSRWRRCTNENGDRLTRPYIAGLDRLAVLRPLQFRECVAASGSNLTFESWKGFPSGSLHASLAHANRNFDFSQAC